MEYIAVDLKHVAMSMEYMTVDLEYDNGSGMCDDLKYMTACFELNNIFL